MSKREFDKEFMLKVVRNQEPEAEIVKNEVIEQTRDTLGCELVFRYDDKLWSTHYWSGYHHVGDGEVQVEEPWEWEEEVECVEVEPVEKLVTVYEAVE